MSVSQADFTRAILDPTREVPAGLTNPDGVTASKRFNVYRNSVAVSLTEALETAFPVIRKLVGEANFKILAGAYLRQHPPASPLMMHYGQEMPQFVAAFEPTKSLGYLPDVARLELALRGAYHAADPRPFDPTTLQTMPPDRLMAAYVDLAPAVRLIRSRYPIYSIWRFNMEPGAPKPEPRGQNVLVLRPEFDPVCHVLAPGGGTFVAALMDGARFGDAFEAATAQVPDFDLSTLLGQLLSGGGIAAIDERDST
ncbi:MAG: DNA-binding domain-containing protein [Pseudomonadota bacterium]